MNSKMYDEEKRKINKLSHYSLGHIYRFAPSEHPYMQHKDLFNYFMERFQELGGMTPELSKQLGWRGV